MKSERSVIRDAIHVGKLAIVSNLSVLPEKEEPTNENFIIEGSKPCRSMLFVIDRKRFAKDILYDSPRYPILGVSDDKDCTTKKEEKKAIIITRYCLDELLTSLGYHQILTRSDIQRIRNTLFDSLGNERLKILSEDFYDEYHECINMMRDKTLAEAFIDRSKMDAFKPIEEQILKRKR